MKFLKKYQLDDRRLNDDSILVTDEYAPSPTSTKPIPNNLVIMETTAGLVIPKGETDTTPVGINGCIRYNTQLNKFECYQDGKWRILATVSLSGAASNYHLSASVSKANTLTVVEIDSVPITQTRSIKYLMHVINGTETNMFEYDVLQDTTNAHIVVYGMNMIGNSIGTLDSSIQADRMVVNYTPSKVDTTITAHQQTLPVLYDATLSEEWVDDVSLINIDNYHTAVKHYTAIAPSTVVAGVVLLSSYRSGRFRYSATYLNYVETEEIEFLYDGSTISFVQYAQNKNFVKVDGTNFSTLGTFNVDLQGSNGVLLYTPNVPTVELIVSEALISDTYVAPTKKWDYSGALINSGHFQTTDTTEIIMDFFQHTKYRCAVYDVQLTKGGTVFAACKLSINHNSVDCNTIQYLKIGPEIGVFRSQLVNDLIQIIYTPADATIVTGTFIKTMIKTL